MEIRHPDDVVLEDVGAEAPGLRVRWLLGPRTGKKRCYLRMFELDPGACSPLHQHPGEHSILVLEGQGLALGEGGEKPIREGTAIHIPGGSTHQLRNTGSAKLVFICVLAETLP